MITKGERSQIKNIIQSPGWQTIVRFVNLYCDKISYASVVRETEWDTLKTAIMNEGQIHGIKKFIQELYDQASQNE